MIQGQPTPVKIPSSYFCIRQFSRCGVAPIITGYTTCIITTTGTTNSILNHIIATFNSTTTGFTYTTTITACTGTTICSALYYLCIAISTIIITCSTGTETTTGNTAATHCTYTTSITY